MSIRVLLVEDDHDLSDSLQGCLADAGFLVRIIPSAQTLAEELAHHTPDIVVMDINLPGASGFEAAAQVREMPRTGLIMLTGRAMRNDRLQGLACGADHYLVKPAEPLELEMVIRNLFRRLREPAAAGDTPAAEPGSWILDSRRWTLTGPAGGSMILSAAERHLLEPLMRTPGEPASRVELVSSRAGPSDLSARSLDILVFRLRRKVERECGLPLPVQSARGVGYVFIGKALLK
ncbi:response regulator transcription factor [Xanthobacter sp. KR7-65]|uniref:response regulator transcription factor n=1 Tax=Xanthobacter sp. KR7-65 TaxID=3156612 RepID=UPI0032B600AA